MPCARVLPRVRTILTPVLVEIICGNDDLVGVRHSKWVAGGRAHSPTRWSDGSRAGAGAEPAAWVAIEGMQDR